MSAWKSCPRTNHRYLDESYDRALEGFLVLSAVKSGLAVIEGSEVGIGFSLEVGDLVQSVYDYVNIAWKTVLAGGTILLITRLALDGVTLVDHWVLALVFFLFFSAGRCSGTFPAPQGDRPDHEIHDRHLRFRGGAALSGASPDDSGRFVVVGRPDPGR